jgi:hypothetical protein
VVAVSLLSMSAHMEENSSPQAAGTRLMMATFPPRLPSELQHILVICTTDEWRKCTSIYRSSDLSIGHQLKIRH